MELYEIYKEEVLDELRKMVGEKEVQLIRVQKNNGVELDGVTIRAEKDTLTPTVYLNDYYTNYQNGDSAALIAESIYRMQQTFQCNTPVAIEFFADFSRIKDRILCKVIHREQNKVLLKKIPHLEFLDLAIVFYCLVDYEMFGFSTILVYHSHLKMWEQTLELLYPLALENTKGQLGIQLKTMYETIQELSEDSFEEASSMKSMYVLTNCLRMYGAVCILFREVLHEAAELFEDDFYILPSSVHEVILIAASIAQRGHLLTEMVRDINSSYVSREEILSDEIYYYDKEKKCVLVYK